MLPQEIKEILERGDYRIQKGKLERFNAIDDAWNEVVPDKKREVRIKNMKGQMEAVSIGQFMPNNMREVMKHSGEPIPTKEVVGFKIDDVKEMYVHETELNPLIANNVFDKKKIQKQLDKIKKNPEKAKPFEPKDFHNDYDKLKRSNKRPRKTYPTPTPIRDAEIKQIRKLLGEGKNQTQIADDLKLGRLAVRNIMLKIEQGKPLRYEVKPEDKLPPKTK